VAGVAVLTGEAEFRHVHRAEMAQRETTPAAGGVMRRVARDTQKVTWLESNPATWLVFRLET